MYTHSPEGQPYSRLHQKKRGQQVEGRDSAALLCSGETSPAAVCSASCPQYKKYMELLKRVQRRETKMTLNQKWF